MSKKKCTRAPIAMFGTVNHHKGPLREWWKRSYRRKLVKAAKQCGCDYCLKEIIGVRQ